MLLSVYAHFVVLGLVTMNSKLAHHLWLPRDQWHRRYKIHKDSLKFFNLDITSPRQKYMTVCFYNAQSVGRGEKRSEIELFVRDESIDVLMLTEIWLRRQGDEAKCADMALAAYTIRSFPRSTQGGGGG